MAEVPYRVELEGLDGGPTIVRSLQVILDGLRTTPFQISNTHLHVGTALPEGNEIGDIGDLYIRVDKGTTASGFVVGAPVGSTDLSSTLTPTLYTKVRQNGTVQGWSAVGAWQYILTTQTGTQNDWAPQDKTLLTNTAIVFTGTATLTIQGFPRGYNGQQILVLNNTTDGTTISLAHASTGSLYGNRLTNLLTNANTLVGSGGYALYVYTGTTWTLVGHEQGSWITPAFAAGDYTANGTQTWTVESGDVSLNRYYVAGKRMWWELLLFTTSVGGGANTQLRAAIPGGHASFAFVSQIHVGPCRVSDSGGAYGLGAIQMSTASSQKYVEFYTGYAESGNWTAATNTTAVQATMTLEIA